MLRTPHIWPWIEQDFYSHMASFSLILSMLKNPTYTGAVLPSSRYLAEAMAKQAGDAQSIIELGAGTGAITQSLLQCFPEIPFIAVELQPQLAHQLQERFPSIQVMQASAKQVLDALPCLPEKQVLISSLPFRSLPAEIHSETVQSILHLLQRCPGNKLVQFTYGQSAPFRVPSSYKWQLITRVWRNVPPARVWVLRYENPTP